MGMSPWIAFLASAPVYAYLYSFEATSLAVTATFTVISAVVLSFIVWVAAGSKSDSETNRTSWGFWLLVTAVFVSCVGYGLTFHDLGDDDLHRRAAIESSRLGSAIIVVFLTWVPSLGFGYLVNRFNPHTTN